MSWSRDDGRRGYHHGNLREALIRGALELIAAKGPAGFTVAEDVGPAAIRARFLPGSQGPDQGGHIVLARRRN